MCRPVNHNIYPSFPPLALIDHTSMIQQREIEGY